MNSRRLCLKDIQTPQTRGAARIIHYSIVPTSIRVAPSRPMSALGH
jgi:hypothetical protein